jgi:hydroxymethylpyrimidine pyrophosphatase-like HAD family hydrolase
MDLMPPLISGSSAALPIKREMGNDIEEADSRPLLGHLLEAEESFYGRYPWCLNPFVTVAEAVVHLREEIDKLKEPLDDWQHQEVQTNIFLLSCGILNAVEDYLHGGSSSFSKALSLFRVGKLMVRVGRKVARPFRTFRLRRLRQWQEDWKTALDDCLQLYVTGQHPVEKTMAHCQDRLLAALSVKLPDKALVQLIRVPTAFRGQDLTPFDVLKLGQKWVEANPDRRQPVIVVGLRTSGSYFAPLVRAHLRTEGYQQLDLVTLRPREGAGPGEFKRLKNGAIRGYLAILLDDAPGTGDSVAVAARMLVGAGFPRSRISALLPLHQASRDWNTRPEASFLSRIRVWQLEPEERRKRHLLTPEAVESRLQEYFRARYPLTVRVVDSVASRRLNNQMLQLGDETRETRWKCVYEVHLHKPDGGSETRYVLAKSIGWGWLAYHAFIAGSRLQQFVPPILGLRDGILYTEWLPQTPSISTDQENRQSLIRSMASYVAARVRLLSLERDPSADLRRVRQHPGLDLLARSLGKAYASYTAGELERDRIQLELSRRPCPYPTLIDGKMRQVDWIKSPAGSLKSDFEHHGLGKHELNVVDPTYDLAEAILHLGLSPDEERQLVDDYMKQCPDTEVEERLFLNKFLAGTAALEQALQNMEKGRLAHRQQQFHQQYLVAWNFLTWQAAYFCGRLCRPPLAPQWQRSLAVLDIDGVLDRRVFGFPSTTVAGIQALSMLHAHDFGVVVNTARSVADVKVYCQAYGLAGGVAEYGSYVWDAVRDRGNPQVSVEAREQLNRVRDALRLIPGVFLDDGYQLSVRAFTYEQKRTTPIPTALAHRILADLKADRLRLQQNIIDTAIVAKEVDKGTGLLALLDWAEQRDVETFAIGDSGPDLAMFRVATRSFAPTRMSCRRELKELKCQISRRLYQPGLLRIVRSLVHPDGQSCPRCRSCGSSFHKVENPLLKFFEIADSSRHWLRVRAILDFLAFHCFPEK